MLPYRFTELRGSLSFTLVGGCPVRKQIFLINCLFVNFIKCQKIVKTEVLKWCLLSVQNPKDIYTFLHQMFLNNCFEN